MIKKTIAVIILFAYAFDSVACHRRHYQSNSGCFLQNQTLTDDGRSRKFQLDIADDEVHFILTMARTRHDMAMTTIRNLRQAAPGFTMNSYQEGKNELETTLVKGSYEILLTADTGFSSTDSLCYFYEPIRRPHCQKKASRVIKRYFSYLHCKIDLPADGSHHLIKFDYKFSRLYVAMDKPDISLSNYDYMSWSSPLLFTVQPHSVATTAYFMLVVEAYPGLEFPVGYSITQQAYSACLSRDLHASEQEMSSGFTVTIPQPGAYVTVISTPREATDIDLYINRLPAPADVSQYELRSQQWEGEQDIVETWLQGGDYSFGYIAFSALDRASLCYSFQQPDDIPLCGSTDNLFGSLFFSYQKCKIVVDPSESDQLLTVNFGTPAVAVIAAENPSVSRNNYDLFATFSPLLYPVARSLKRQTLYVMVISYYIKKSLHFSYSLNPLSSDSHTSQCFFENAPGEVGDSPIYPINVDRSYARMVAIFNPRVPSLYGSSANFQLRLAATNGKGNLGPFLVDTSNMGQVVVLDAWLAAGQYELSYNADFSFTSGSFCFMTVEGQQIPDCNEIDQLSVANRGTFFQCKIQVHAAPYTRQLTVVANRKVWRAQNQIDFYLRVDSPMSPSGQFDYSNSERDGKSPFIKVEVPAFQSHTYYVLLGSNLDPDSFIIVSHRIRPKFWFDASQSYSNVRPLPAPTSEQSCGHSQYWNSGEGYAASLGVVGGSPARNHEFPWQVSIVRTNADGKRTFFGGSILNDRWIMTTAQCCLGYNKLELYFGTNQGFLNVVDSISQEPDQAVIHPYFNANSLVFDFCLVKLKAPLDFNAWSIQPICLPESCEEGCQPGDRLLLSGYGQLGEERGLAQWLQSVIIPWQSPIEAQEVVNSLDSGWHNFQQHFIRYPVLAAGIRTGGYDACRGDEGGVLACFKSGAFTLVGHFSFSDICALPLYPTGYAKVCAVLSWIHSYIDA